MKVTKLTLLSAIGLTLGLVSAQALPATDAQASINSALVGVSGLELPSKTAGLIAAAPDQQKSAVTVSAVETAVNMSPSSACAIVGAVAGKVPSVAALAAATAAKLQPKQAPMIAEAASKAAPSQAAEIVSACSKELPYQYASIAVGASKGAPEAKQQILAAASAASPAPIRAHLVAAASAPAVVPVDVAIAQAYTRPATVQNFGSYAPAEVIFQDIPGMRPGAIRVILQASHEHSGGRKFSGHGIAIQE